MGIAPDVVVVGAGAGGAAAAWRLTSAGARVLLLEAGPRFDPARDYPQTRPGWERRGFPTPPGSVAPVSFGDLGALDPAHEDLASWTRVTGRVVSGGRREVAGPGYAHVQGYGGSTLHFTGEAHRLNPRAMRLASDHGAGADWPITAADLAPHYAACERLIGVAGTPPPDGRRGAAPHLQPPHPLNTAARALQTPGAALGLTLQSNTRAALSRPLDGRPPCNYCGACLRGCPLGDKGSADVTFLRAAEATGRLTVETGAQVVRLVPGPGGRIAAVDVLRGGRRRRVETPLLILAAGAVQTPRLLLASAGPDAPEGVANGSGQVGRNFIETLYWASTGLLPGLKDSDKGLPADAVAWDYNAPGAVPGAVGGCRFTSAVQELGHVGPVAYATRLVPGFGPAFKARMRAVFGSAVSVSGLAECLPDPRSRVDLDPGRRDAAGVPLPRITSILSDNSLTHLHFMAAKARRWLAGAGVTELVEETGAWDRFYASHVFGTCRMGDDPETSVVDARGRSHEIGNLYVADASVFPSGGGGEAPSLTIQALALRTADAALAGSR